MHKCISWVVQSPLTYHAKSLARRSSKQYVDVPRPDTGMLANVFSVDFRHTPADSCTFGKIELVCSAMYRVVLNRSCYIESSLLEAKTHPTGTRKKIDADGSFLVAAHLGIVLQIH